MPLSRVVGVTIWLALLVAVTPVRTQTPLQFRAAVDLIHLDVSVLDRDRRPVRGLTAADFTILEDGRPQAVSTFAAVDIPDVPPPTTTWLRTLTPDTRRNDTLDDRRLFVMVIDDATAELDMHALATTRKAAKAFVDRLGPTDLAAVLFTTRNQHSQDYTSDKVRLHKAIDAFNGGFRGMGGSGGGLPDTDEFYYRGSVDVLRRVAEALIALPQRRKTLVYIGQGVPVDPEAGAEVTMIAPGNPAAIQASSMNQVLVDRTQKVLAAAQRANVNIYTIDTCGLRMPADFTRTCKAGLEQEYLKDLAHATGGRAAVDTNDVGPAVEQIFVENGSYYLLGFSSNNVRRDGKFRRLEVKVNRPDVEVRTRSGYTEPSSQQETREAALEESSPLGKAISGLLPKGDVPLQIWAAPFGTPGKPNTKDAMVAWTVAVRQSLAERIAATSDQVDISVDVYTPEGRHRLGRQMVAKVALRPGQPGAVAYEVSSSLPLPPGRYQMRVAARLRTSKVSGSIYYDIDVPDLTKGEVTMGGLALTAVPAVNSASTDNPEWLPIRPTTAREFVAAGRLRAFTRVYQPGRSVRPVRVRARLVDASDRTVWSIADDISASRFENKAADVLLDVPLGSLSRGAYLLAIEVLGDNDRVVASRETQIAVR